MVCSPFVIAQRLSPKNWAKKCRYWWAALMGRPPRFSRGHITFCFKMRFFNFLTIGLLLIAGWSCSRTHQRKGFLQMDKLLKTGVAALLPALMGLLGAAAALMVPEFYGPFCRGIVSAVL